MLNWAINTKIRFLQSSHFLTKGTDAANPQFSNGQIRKQLRRPSWYGVQISSFSSSALISSSNRINSPRNLLPRHLTSSWELEVVCYRLAILEMFLGSPVNWHAITSLHLFVFYYLALTGRCLAEICLFLWYPVINLTWRLTPIN